MHCGLDEAGRGPVIGPMVIAMVCGDPKYFSRIGARDSKELSDARRREIYAALMEGPVSVRFTVVSPEELNQKMDNMTLNQIELEKYAAIIQESPGDAIVFVDSFDVNPVRLQDTLRSLTGRKVYCHHHADRDYPVVSAASIVAKVIRDDEIERLKARYGEIGSGYPSDPLTVRFLKHAVETGMDIHEIARLKWKTFQRIASVGRNRKLF
ncbi:MAG TPA: ribonuclease HII [Thermoplasmataceae archaeon]|nr:ribonuclease HII [Thermoplasmataceae archaeon]